MQIRQKSRDATAGSAGGEMALHGPDDRRLSPPGFRGGSFRESGLLASKSLSVLPDKRAIWKVSSGLKCDDFLEWGGWRESHDNVVRSPYALDAPTPVCERKRRNLRPII